MQKYKQYCPVARASEILADRWTPLIVRELILGSHRFNEIERGLPGISRSLLASRLRDLEDAGVVERLPGAQPKALAYHLSEAGRDLKTVIESLGAWGVRWAFGEPRPEELDAGLLIWRIHQRIDRELLPERRTVVEFDFTGPRGRRVWLLLEPREVSVCVTPPGFDSDLDRSCGSGVLLSCLVGTHRVRRRHSLSLGGCRRASRSCEATSAVVHVEPDGAFRSGTRAHGGAGLKPGPCHRPPRGVTFFVHDAASPLWAHGGTNCSGWSAVLAVDRTLNETRVFRGHRDTLRSAVRPIADRRRQLRQPPST